MPLDRLISVSCVVFCALTAAEALAYIPPSEFMVKNWVQKHNVAKGVRARAWVAVMDGDKPSASVRFKLQAVARTEDGLIRWSALDEQGTLLYVTEDKSEGPFASLLFDSSSPHVIHVLKSAGIPIKTQRDLAEANVKDEEERVSAESATLSLNRAKRQIAWVIGRKDAGDSASQLWIEKDSFLPIRLKTAAGEAALENYRFFHDFPFPRLVTWTEGKNAVFRQDLIDLVVNPPELAQLKSPATTGFTEAGNSAPSPVRDLIQKYFEKAR